MCLEMDTKVEWEVLKPCYSRRSGKLSKCRLRKILNLSSRQEGLKMWRANIVKATLKKYIRCEQKRRLVAKLVKQEQTLSENCENIMHDGTETVDGNTRSICSMAPKNTTQYLMDIVYDDMLNDTSSSQKLSPDSLEICVPSKSLSRMTTCDSLDCGYENSLEFQQRDFEEIYLHLGSC